MVDQVQHERALGTQLSDRLVRVLATFRCGFYPSSGLHRWLRTIVWLVLIGVWALASIR